MVSRRLYNLLLSSAPQELKARYTPLRWADTFARQGERLLQVLMTHFGFEPRVEGSLVRLARLYERHTLDPHVKRARLREGMYA